MLLQASANVSTAFTQRLLIGYLFTTLSYPCYPCGCGEFGPNWNEVDKYFEITHKIVIERYKSPQMLFLMLVEEYCTERMYPLQTLFVLQNNIS